MTRGSIIGYADAVGERYFSASKKTKGEMLNEFVATTGLHRKAALRLYNRRNRPPGRKRCGCPTIVWARFDGSTQGGLASDRSLVLQTFPPLFC